MNAEKRSISAPSYLWEKAVEMQKKAGFRKLSEYIQYLMEADIAEGGKVHPNRPLVPQDSPTQSKSKRSKLSMRQQN